MVNALRQLQLDDLCVHQVTLSGQCDFANSLAVLRNAGIKRTALWTPMINSCGISEAKRIWDSAGMTAESLCVACLFEAWRSPRYLTGGTFVSGRAMHLDIFRHGGGGTITEP